MSVQHPTSDENIKSTAQPPEVKEPRKKTRLAVLLLVLIIVALLIGWQIVSVGANNSDPRTAGRPLSNPQMHLHTVVPGGKPGVIYLGTHAGLFTSNDGGHTWPQTRGILNSLMITNVAVNTKDASSLALVGIPNSSSASAQAGIYFSLDNGATWHLRQPRALPGSSYPFTVRSGSAGPGHFYAFYLYAGWFETRDAGLHWKPITNSALSNTQNSLILTFSDEPKHLLMGGDAGMFESKDDGLHWSNLSAVHGAIQALTASSQLPATVYCATDQGLFTWQQNSSSTVQAAPLPNGSTAVFGRISSAASGKILYGLTSRDLWYSNDAGKHWARRYHFDRGDFVALLVDPQNAQRVYVGFFLPPKVIFSSNGGSSWAMLTQ